MFSNLNFWEIGALLLLALFIFGPERLPKVISDGVRMLRTVRDMARNATDDLSRELGTEVRLEDLHPKAFIRKHLLSEEEEAQIRRPFDDAFSEVKQIATDANDSMSVRPRADAPTPRAAEPNYGSAYGKDNGFPVSAPEERRQDPVYGADNGYDTPAPDPRRYDSDAT